MFGGVFSNGAVAFDITNQAPPDPDDDDGSEVFALATQMALGLGNAGEGDKYHFRFETTLVASGAIARGHGFLFVPADTGVATFVIAGHGTHPLAGPFGLMGGGDVDCAVEEAAAAQADVLVDYRDVEDEDTFVNMVRCQPGDPCEPPEG